MKSTTGIEKTGCKLREGWSKVLDFTRKIGFCLRLAVETERSQYLSKDVQATRAMVAAGLGVSLNNAILAYGLDLSAIVTLPTQPSAEVGIGIAAPKRENRSPAPEQFLRYALDHLPEPSPVSFRPKRKTEWE